MKPLFTLIINILLLVNCSFNKQPKDGLAFIDFKKNYPVKDILLTNIADITYLHLNTDDDEYLYKGYEHIQRGGISYLTRNTVVVVDAVSESILFFSKDGTPKSRFNRKGQGPGEYTLFFSDVIYDETADEVYITNLDNNFIQVYSSFGEYKRTLKLPQGIMIRELSFFDEHSLFFLDFRFESQKTFARLKGADIQSDKNVMPFYRISATTGEVLDYIELPCTNLFLGINWNGMRIVNGSSIFTMKCKEGMMLCNPGIDTIFIYKGDNSLVPVLYQTPSVALLNPMEYLDFCLDRGQYRFIKTIIVREGNSAPAIFPAKYYMLDKKTGTIVRPKFLLQDYMGKEFIIDPYNQNNVGKIYNDGYCFELDLYELKQAYHENKLSGKLKELVATLNEDEDNNVFMLVQFK